MRPAGALCPGDCEGVQPFDSLWKTWRPEELGEPPGAPQPHIPGALTPRPVCQTGSKQSLGLDALRLHDVR